MNSDDPTRALLDDLELQAEGLHLEQRDQDIEDLSRAAYAEVELLARLQASIGRQLRIRSAGEGEVGGRLRAVGRDWLRLEAAAARWLLPLAGIAWIEGLDRRAVPAEARPIAARLSLRSALRDLVELGEPVVLRLFGGAQLDGVPERVGADFVEVRRLSGASVAVPLTSISAVRSQR